MCTVPVVAILDVTVPVVAILDVSDLLVLSVRP